MKLTLLFVLLTMLGCATPVRCVTTCGLQLSGAETWTCPQFQQFEDLTLRAFASPRITDARFATACQRVQGIQVHVRDTNYLDELREDAGIGQRPFEVLGSTQCDLGLVEIGHLSLRGTFAHELAHVVQACTPIPPPGWYPTKLEGPQHAGWMNAGIQEAIYQAANAPLDGGT